MKVIRDLKELEQFARDFVKENPHGAVVALEGDLGAGKTTFVRQVIAVIAEMKNEKVPRIVSPTFVLHQRYEMGGISARISIDHFDLYRLNEVGASASIEIGLQEAVAQNQNGFVFVEWPSKLTKDAGITFTKRLRFEIQEDGSRSVSTP